MKARYRSMHTTSSNLLQQETMKKLRKVPQEASISECRRRWCCPGPQGSNSSDIDYRGLAGWLYC